MERWRQCGIARSKVVADRWPNTTDQLVRLALSAAELHRGLGVPP
ncbi:hypothetical protein AB0F72_31110 [Actinoplanes sp. NPDC023936]